MTGGVLDLLTFGSSLLPLVEHGVEHSAGAEAEADGRDGEERLVLLAEA